MRIGLIHAGCAGGFDASALRELPGADSSVVTAPVELAEVRQWP
jgi:hypothetical protein